MEIILTKKISIKEKCIKSHDQQGYRILEIPINTKDPKALTRFGWNKEPTNLNIGRNNMYAVIQEDNKLVFDFDDIEFNDILSDYLDKTLVTETGNGGRHYYFKDIKRVKPIKISTLYKNSKPIGDIRAHMSYVVGCGSSYQEDGKTKTYTQISSTNIVLEIDCEIILQILKKNGITTTKGTESKISFKDGLKEGERNTECFKTACEIFEKRKLDFDSGLNFIKNWNSLSKKPLDDSEIEKVVKSAWDRITNKEISFDGKEKIDNVTRELRSNNYFITQRKTEEILVFNGKIYDNLEAESMIKEETEKLIPQCTKHDRSEVIDKIKSQTYRNLEDFDSDPNIITVENGILNIEEERVTPHTPEHLSKVLLPIEYQKPKYPIKEGTIFADIELNLRDTLFWKYLKGSFTVDGKFRKNDFETILESVASVFIKRQIDHKAFLFLGNGNNGKSVILSYIELMLGKNTKNVTHITLHDIAEDKFMTADLVGVSANIFSDLEENELKHAGKIKDIIAGEGLQVQRKHGHPFILFPFCKLMFSCNRFPKSFDQSQGFFRRWIIVKWERDFENDPENIPDLLLKLSENKEELGLVFSCLIPLANKLNRNGVFTHTKTWKEIQKEWNENADPLESFIINFIIEDMRENARKTKIETFQFYKKTMFELGETPLTIARFGKEFGEMFDDSKVEGVRYWLNIEFRVPKQTELKTEDKT